MGSTSDGQKALSDYRSNGVTEALQLNIRDDPDWKVSRPTVIWRGAVNTGSEKAQVCLVDRRCRVAVETQVLMTVQRDPEDGWLQWYIEHVQPYRELLVSVGNL